MNGWMNECMKIIKYKDRTRIKDEWMNEWMNKYHKIQG